MERVVDEQIRRAGPDILWVFSGVPMTDAGVKQWRSSADSAVLWWSCALVESTPYDRFDLILSSIRPLVEEFRSMGLRAEYMPHAFDARVLDRVRPAEHRTSRMAFVGNITPDHRERAEFLDALSRVIEVDFYGLGADFLPPDSPLRARAMGPVWGDDLYRVYAKYALVVHKNIDVAGTSPSAKRLFEATGMGACVLTEDNRELSELFEPGSEVVTYRTTDECIVKARELLAPSSDAYLIGRAGQRRTLEQHTYTRRVQRLLSLVDNVKAESRGVAVGSPTPRA
jgi:spore maturation protein CgeB